MVEVTPVGRLSKSLELNATEDDAGCVGAGGDRGGLACEPFGAFVLSEVIEPPSFDQGVCRNDRPSYRQQQQGDDIRTHGGMVAHECSALTP